MKTATILLLATIGLLLPPTPQAAEASQAYSLNPSGKRLNPEDKRLNPEDKRLNPKTRLI